MNRKKIGIIGGTFDPIHYGHLILAEYSRTVFGLNEVLFIPTGTPPHKDEEGISSADCRYHMTLLATNTNPHFIVSTIEMKRKGTTYTIDTIKQLKEENYSVDYYFILGEDSLLEIHTWKEYDQLLRLCKFIVARRPYTDKKFLMDRVEELNSLYGEHIYILDAPLIEISSTQIRHRINMGLSIRYLVPEAVERYIYKYKMYV